jgi:hypothetical protein
MEEEPVKAVLENTAVNLLNIKMAKRRRLMLAEVQSSLLAIASVVGRHIADTDNMTREVNMGIAYSPCLMAFVILCGQLCWASLCWMGLVTCK